MQQDDVENIRSSVTMKQLAAMYGYEVNRSGMMRCPFHGEDRHPSLKVYDGDRGWWCFVCNEGGDIFDFVMKYDGLEFPKAVERIAEMAGIPLINGSSLSQADKDRIRKRKEVRETAERAREQRNQRMIDISDKIRILEAIKARCEPLSYVWCGAEENITRLSREWDYLFSIQESKKTIKRMGLSVLDTRIEKDYQENGIICSRYKNRNNPERRQRRNQMSIDVKPYGNVYKHIVEAVSDNFGKYTIPWKYNKTVNAMLKTAVDEYKADNTYPIQLHEALSDVVLRWCFDGYTQTDKDDFTAIFQSLWKFHKRWMLIAEVNTASKISQMMNKEATDLIANLCGGINQTYDKRKEKITDLFVVVMTHVIDMSLKEPEE